MIAADSHCHLENNIELEAVMQRAYEAGVRFVLDAGSNLDNLKTHLEICKHYSGVFTAVGAHPHQATEFASLKVKDIVKCCDNDKVVAIGEAGLDYFYDFAPREMQIELFKKNIEAAQITGKPLIIHNRESDDDMISLLQKSYDKKEFKAVVHCYSSGWELAEKALEMGFFISASGIITFPKSQDIRENFAKIPTSRLLIETDAPYLAPVPKRGKTNEPANVLFTAQKLAEIKGCGLEEIVTITTNNFKRLFGI